MKNTSLIILLILSIVASGLTQTITTQTIKGIVLDKDSQMPLIGATVSITSIEPVIGAATDINGNFVIPNVPTGRHNIVCEYIGYKPSQLEGVILNSAKELDLNIELVESVAKATETDIVITAEDKTTNSKKAQNEYSTLSSRSFSVEETQKYPGSIADPSRMALSFAGVQMGQDNNNDIIIRSNSAVGLSWRLEGVDIANPNHFARAGGSGGGVSAFSASVFSNSDFMAGAFAPEYGGALSGVFDMKFRKGNRDKREYTVRAGLLGLDFSTEGPIEKGRSSYLFNYRYSTLGILNAFGLYVVDARTANNFQDLSFNMYFPSKDNKTIVNFWGIGGLSKEQKNPVADTADWKVFDHQTTYVFNSNMGTAGLSMSRLLKHNDYIKTVISASANYLTWDRDSVDLALNRSVIQDEKYLNGRYDWTTFYKRKFSPKFSLKTGLTARNQFYTLERAYLNFASRTYVEDLNTKGSTFQVQYYLQGIYKPSDKLSITGGLHNLYFALNNSWSTEPRISMKYQLSEKSAFTLGYGMHSQPLPVGTYFIYRLDSLGNRTDNQDLEMMKAHHIVGGFDQSFKNKSHINVEVYYQQLYNIPIIPGGSTFWMLNEKRGYGREYGNEPLVSEGTGRNMGIDITFEKYLSRNLFFLITGSVFDSKYTVDGVGTYNTRYNGGYSSSVMIGKEFTLKKNNALSFSFRNFYNGGLRYTPGDSDASLALGDLVEDESRSYEEQMKDYWRIDLQLAYRKNKPNYAWSIILDTQNVLGYENQRELNYDYKLNDFIFKPQSGFLPVISFQMDF